MTDIRYIGVAYSGPPMGFIVHPDPGVRTYHCGDTALFGKYKGREDQIQ